jgi:hypothetical protein
MLPILLSIKHYSNVNHFDPERTIAWNSARELFVPVQLKTRSFLYYQQISNLWIIKLI